MYIYNIYIYIWCKQLSAIKRINMGHIGRTIEKYRQALSISRKELAEDICSEKHIYLIEKGERSPSANILKQLSEKLGVNLFEFYQYIDCENPIEVRDKIKDFYMYRANLDFITLMKVSVEAYDMWDFRNKPYSFEIRLNDLYYMAFEDNRYEETKVKLKKLLKEAEIWKYSEMFLVNVHTLMTTLCLITQDFTEAKNSALKALKIFQRQFDVEKNLPLSTTMIVNLMGAYYVNGEYDVVIDIGNKFLKIKQAFNSYDRIHYIYFFMSFACYTKNMREEAYIFLKKAIYILMMDFRPTDVTYVAMIGELEEMLEDLDKDSELIREFRKKYKI